MNQFRGSPQYICPEMWLGKPYDNKCDMWALGVILYNLCTNLFPFDGDYEYTVEERVCMGKYKQIPPKYSKDLANIINSCLKLNPIERASAASLWTKTEVLTKVNESDFCKRNNIIRESMVTPKCPIKITKTIRRISGVSLDNIDEGIEEEDTNDVKESQSQSTLSI